MENIEIHIIENLYFRGKRINETQNGMAMLIIGNQTLKWGIMERASRKDKKRKKNCVGEF